MRCLYCGKQLALLRRLTAGREFCSEAHKQSYHDEYNKLALSRLLEAQSKPDEPRPRLASHLQPAASPESGGQTKGIEAPRTSNSREAEGWTPAPQRVAAPPPPPTPELPPKPGFLLDKPCAVEAQSEFAHSIPRVAIGGAAAPILRIPELDVRPIEYRPSTPPRSSDLFLVKHVAAAHLQSGIQRISSGSFTGQPLPVLVEMGRMGLEAGFNKAGRLPIDIAPVTLGKAEPELQPPLRFAFLVQSESNTASGPQTPDGAEASKEDIDEPTWAGLLPLKLEPVPPNPFARVILPMPLLAESAGATALPSNRALPVLPRIGDGAAWDSNAEAADKSRWNNVQKHLNIVSCLVLAGLGGLLYWHAAIQPELTARLSVIRTPAVAAEERN